MMKVDPVSDFFFLVSKIELSNIFFSPSRWHPLCEFALYSVFGNDGLVSIVKQEESGGNFQYFISIKFC